VQRLFLWKSLARRRAIAADYRNKSGAATAEKQAEIMDVNQRTVENYMRRFGVQRLIHGHTHRPADHRFDLDGRAVTRHVLAEWSSDRGEALIVSDGKARRETVAR
jgi:UDP-2,3-diacylglucosamine hydrolase